MLKFYFKDQNGEPYMPVIDDALEDQQPRDTGDQGQGTENVEEERKRPGYRMQLWTMCQTDERLKMKQAVEVSEALGSQANAIGFRGIINSVKGELTMLPADDASQRAIGQLATAYYAVRLYFVEAQNELDKGEDRIREREIGNWTIGIANSDKKDFTAASAQITCSHAQAQEQAKLFVPKTIRMLAGQPYSTYALFVAAAPKKKKKKDGQGQEEDGDSTATKVPTPYFIECTSYRFCPRRYHG
jgi:hypothetical protein